MSVVRAGLVLSAIVRGEANLRVTSPDGAYPVELCGALAKTTETELMIPPHTAP